MNAEKIHRDTLKELGYKKDHIEKLVIKYRNNLMYEFAEECYKKQLSINGVMQAKPEKVCPMCDKPKEMDEHNVCEDCGGRSF